MSVSRALPRCGLLVLLLGLAAAGPDQPVQSGSAPSPIAPGDLSKPVFDTSTPVYSSVTSLDKAATTVVAEVEGRPITLGDVGDAVRALPASIQRLPFDSIYPGVLENLIKQEAIVVRAQQQGLDDDPTVRRHVKAAADRQLVQEFLERKTAADVTEAALLDRYNHDIANHPGPEEVHARVILTETEQQAADVIARIKGGADFASIAQKLSKDVTASTGGDLGYQTRESMNPEIAAVAFSLSVGQVTAFPVRTGAGWFVVKVEERRSEPAPSFAQVREDLRLKMEAEDADAVSAAAIKDMKIRRYSFTGAEVGSEKPESPVELGRSP